MSEFDDVLAQVQSLPALLRDETKPITDRLRRVLQVPDIFGFRQIVLTGSGDSYFAALASAPAFRAWTGLPVVALPAMEASRYLDAGLPPIAGRKRGLLVVAISNSGEGARLVEAVARLRLKGAVTLAITANPTSRLAQATEAHIDVTLSQAVPGPGVRSYVASLLALNLLGIRFAEVLGHGTMDDAGVLRSALAGLAAPLEQAIAATMPVAAAKASEWAGFAAADAIGSGPGFGTASYAAAKLVEMAGIHAAAHDTEEFVHVGYFAGRPATIPTVLFAARSAVSASRALEVADALKQLGRPYLVVTEDTPDDDAAPTRVAEWGTPILHVVPAVLLAAHWGKANGAAHFGGRTGAWSGEMVAPLIRNSWMEIE